MPQKQSQLCHCDVKTHTRNLHIKCDISKHGKTICGTVINAFLGWNYLKSNQDCQVCAELSKKLKGINIDTSNDDDREATNTTALGIEEAQDSDRSDISSQHGQRYKAKDYRQPSAQHPKICKFTADLFKSCTYYKPQSKLSSFNTQKKELMTCP